MKKQNPANRKKRAEIFEEVVNDKSLLPLFIDYLGENLKMTCGQKLDVSPAYKEEFIKSADAKLDCLVKKLSDRVPKRDINFIVEKACYNFASNLAITPTSSDKELEPIDLVRLMATLGLELR